MALGRDVDVDNGAPSPLGDSGRSENSGSGGLLDDLRQGLRNPDTQVSHLLRLVLMLGTEVGAGDLADWARKELNGYEVDDALPDCRVLPVHVTADVQFGNMMKSGEHLSLEMLPSPLQERFKDGFPMLNSLSNIEDLIRDSGTTLSFPLPQQTYVRQHVEHQVDQAFTHIHAVYLTTGRAVVADVIEQVRTRLAEMVGHLMRQAPEHNPTPAQVRQGANIVLHGASGTVNIAAPAGDSSPANATQSASQVVAPEEDGVRWWRRPKVLAVGGAVLTVAGVVAAWGQWLKWMPFG